MTARLIHRAHVGRRHARPLAVSVRYRIAFVVGRVFYGATLGVLSIFLIGPVLYGLGVQP